MNFAKLLNIFLLAFLLSLGIQMFIGGGKQNTTTPQDVVLEITDDSIVIPNIPQIQIKNFGTSALLINPCQDIKLSIDSRPVTGIDTFAPEFCEPLTVNANSGTLIPFGKIYQIFAKQSGKYVTTVTTPYGERTTFFEVSAPGGIRTLLSVLVYQPIYNLFVGLLTFLPAHSLGWAIIIVTIIIRIILLVPQHHMLMSQKKLQVIQPKIKALQKEYKNDSATLGMKMLELYKKENVNPFGAFVPLLIQMPILIGLYWVISQINDSSNFYHLYGIFQAFNPTEISTYFYGLHLDTVGGITGIILAVVLGAIQWLQAYLSVKHTKKHEKKDAVVPVSETPEMALDPEMMQKMMLYVFPIVIGVTSYFFPLGVGLYWFIGTLFVIIQQWYVNTKKTSSK